MPKTTYSQRLKFCQEAVLSKTDECVLWPYRVTKNGSGVLSTDPFELAHRFVCAEVHGDKTNEGFEVRHRCADRRCLNPRHLEWVEHGVQQRGPRKYSKPPGKIPAKKILCEEIARQSSNNCIEWLGSKNTCGYGLLAYKSFHCAHRYICFLAHGEAPTPSHEVAHSCNNRGCVNPGHLRWATRTENQHDRIDHGTSNRGENGGRAKLTESNIIDIRTICAFGATRADVARAFGVACQTVSAIVLRQTWRHI